LDSTPFGVPAEVEANPGAGELLLAVAEPALELALGVALELALVPVDEVAGEADFEDDPSQPARIRHSTASGAGHRTAGVLVMAGLLAVEAAGR
jgi:hypothetical protein